MNKPFQPGDVVFHRNLKCEGVVVPDAGLGSQDVSIYVEFKDHPDYDETITLEVSHGLLSLVTTASPHVGAPKGESNTMALYELVKYDPSNPEHVADAERHDYRVDVECYGDTLHLLYINGSTSGMNTYEQSPGEWFIHNGVTGLVPGLAHSKDEALECLRRFVSLTDEEIDAEAVSLHRKFRPTLG